MKTLNFIGFKGSLLCKQKLATGPCPESDEARHTLLPSFSRSILTFFRLLPGLPSDLAASGFLSKTSHVHLHCPVYNVCFDHFILSTWWDHVLKIVNGLTGQRSLFTISYMFLLENIKHPLEHEEDNHNKDGCCCFGHHHHCQHCLY